LYTTFILIGCSSKQASNNKNRERERERGGGGRRSKEIVWKVISIYNTKYNKYMHSKNVL
jgi:hypothetical protein